MASGSVIKLQGEEEYKQALKQITSGLKLMSSELKLASAEFTSGDKTLKQTKTSYDSMNKAVQEQKTGISNLKNIIVSMTKEYENQKGELADLEKQYGADSKEVAKFKKGIAETEIDLKKYKTQLNNAELQLKQMEEATDKSTKELKEMKDGFNEAGSGALKFGDVLKANVIGDFIVDGIKEVGRAVWEMGKQAIAGFGEFEQLEGGVKKLFGDDMTTVIKNANDAYKTAGMSTNEYMETVTSFSASLINSLKGNTKEATKYADMAIRDMSDNANTFGTDISMIQNAYQGFAKQNYTMLDNLKLGYGGTKTEMERLLKEAEKMPEAMGRKFDMSNYADIVQAINVVQQNMKITGTTFNEASGTIEGSISSMKSAWENWLSGLANGNADLSQLTSNLITGVTDVINNLKPAISQIFSSLGENLPQLLNLGSGMVKDLVDGFLLMAPNLMSAGLGIVDKISEGIKNNLPNFISKALDLISGFADFLTANVPILISKGIEMIRNLVQGLMSALPELISRVPEIISKFANVINDNAPTIIKGGFNIILDIIKGLLNAIPTLIANIPKILTAILDVWEAFNWLSLGQKAIQFVGNGITSMLGFAKTSMTSIKDGAVNMIRDLPSNLFNIGKNAVTNLGGAINSMKTWAVDIVKNLGTSIINGIKNVLSWQNIKQIGTDLVKGLWNGISDMTGWIIGKIQSFGGDILGGIKNFFGIKSPSKVFEDEVGQYLALGIGEGFKGTMNNVSKDMQRAIPTEFDTNATINGTSGSFADSNYNSMVNAFKEALTKVKVVMDDREMGTFVTDTMERVVFN